MRTIVVKDLANPVLTAEQRALIEAADRHPSTLTVAAVLAAAQHKTGLEDFGPNDFRARLAIWLSAVEQAPDLLNLGKTSIFNNCVNLAVARLRLQALLQQHPEILEQPIESPIIVAGLPRSGTTHLVNLIAADQRLRSLPLWEALEPFPAPEDLHNDQRFERCAAAWRKRDRLLPYQSAMHPMTPEHIHEETELLDIDFSSYNLEWLAYVPSWRDYYLSHDQTPHYGYMKRALQALQWLRGPRRWVLKSPQHLEQLGPLLQTFPDATLAITHRDPVAVIQSLITMNCYCQRLRMSPVDTRRIAGYWVDRIERMLRACVRDHALVPATQKTDVIFHDFMQDDMAVVETLYHLANLPLNKYAAQQLRAFSHSHPRGQHGRVAYDLQRDFGIAPDELRERFRFYFERFPIRAEV